MHACWLKVAVPVSDLWIKPDFESGRTNQVLFGQILRAEKRRKNHRFVYTLDNYCGWINFNHVRPLYERDDKLRQSAIRIPLASIYKSFSGQRLETRLSFGSIVSISGQEKGGRIRLIEPSGWINNPDLSMIAPFARPSINRIIKSLKSFLGTPYLWGGRSGFGLDCSGLVQLVYNFHGLELPRDTKDQIQCGRKVALKNIAKGDLIFSPGHVSIYLGRGKIIHSSLKAGGVAIESIWPSDQKYRSDIATKIVEIRRVL